MKKPFPKYIDFESHGCAMRHTSNGNYYRDGGEWNLTADFIDSQLKVTACAGNKNLIGLNLVKVSKKWWKKNNGDYV
jgi:hypothetical protein